MNELTLQRSTLPAILFVAMTSTAARAQWTVTNVSQIIGQNNGLSAHINGICETEEVGGYSTNDEYWDVGLAPAYIWHGTAASRQEHWLGAYAVSLTDTDGTNRVGSWRHVAGAGPHPMVLDGTGTMTVLSRPQIPNPTNDYGEAYSLGGGVVSGYAQYSFGITASAGYWVAPGTPMIDVNPFYIGGSPTYQNSGAITHVRDCDQGVFVGFARSSGNGVFHACRWTGTRASYLDIHPASASESKAFSISAGRAVGYATIGGQTHAGLWIQGASTFVDLHPANATASMAVAIHGSVAVGHVTIAGQNRATLWSLDTGQITDLATYLPTGGYWSQFWGSKASCVWTDGTDIRVGGWGRYTAAAGARNAALIWTFVGTPDPTAASVTNFGSGCWGPSGSPHFGATGGSLPVLGQTLHLRLGNLPATAGTLPFACLGFSDQIYQTVPLPMSLAPFGAPGCSMFLSLDLGVVLVPQGAEAPWDLPLPLDLGYVGLDVFAQGGVLVPGWNAAGFAVSNPLRLKVGTH